MYSSDELFMRSFECNLVFIIIVEHFYSLGKILIKLKAIALFVWKMIFISIISVIKIKSNTLLKKITLSAITFTRNVSLLLHLNLCYHPIYAQMVYGVHVTCLEFSLTGCEIYP